MREREREIVKETEYSARAHVIIPFPVMFHPKTISQFPRVLLVLRLGEIFRNG